MPECLYRVFHNCWNKALGHKSRILNDATKMITRASFCCSNKARKLHSFSAKVAFMRCKLHLCAHLTVKDLKQPILHAKIEKVAKSNMQKSKKLQKVACKNRKSCNIKFLETAQNIELYISWVFRKLLEAVKKVAKVAKTCPNDYIYWKVKRWHFIICNCLSSNQK